MKYVAGSRPTSKETAEPIEPGSFDIEELLAKGGEILRREILNLLMESSRGKLSAASSRDLVAYVKLLSELKADALEQLDDLSDDELRKLVE